MAKFSCKRQINDEPERDRGIHFPSKMRAEAPPPLVPSSHQIAEVTQKTATAVEEMNTSEESKIKRQFEHFIEVAKRCEAVLQGPWVGQFIQILEARKEHYIAMLNRAMPLGEEQPNLAVHTSWLKFYMEQTSSTMAQECEPYKIEHQNLGIKELEEIGRIFFDIDIEKISEVSNAATEESEAVPLPQGAAKSPSYETDKMRKRLRKKEKENEPSSTGLLAVPVTLWSLLKDKMADSWNTWRNIHKPEQVLESAWKNNCATEHSQTPGVYDNKGTHAPIIVVHRGSHNTNPRVYTACAAFNTYDPTKDRFEHTQGGTSFQRYVAYDLDDLRMAHLRNALQQDAKLYSMELRGMNISSMRDPQTGLIPLPKPMSRDPQTVFIPVEVEISGLEQQQIKNPICPLYYSQDGDLFFDSSIEGKADVTVHYAAIENKFDHTYGINRLIERNRHYFRCEPKPEIDAQAAACDLSADPELAYLLFKWKALPTVEQKVMAAKEYLSEHYTYAGGWKASAKIRLQRGVNGAEKVMAAKFGNCFDVNEIFYIVLHKLGIPARFQTGFAPNQATEREEKPGTFDLALRHPEQSDYRKPINLAASHADIKDLHDIQLGEEVYLRYVKENLISMSAVQTNAAHAFLTYWDSEKSAWLLDDATPIYDIDQMKYAEEERAKKEHLEDNLHQFMTQVLPKIEQSDPKLSFKVLKNALERLSDQQIRIRKMHAGERLRCFRWHDPQGGNAYSTGSLDSSNFLNTFLQRLERIDDPAEQEKCYREEYENLCHTAKLKAHFFNSYEQNFKHITSTFEKALAEKFRFRKLRMYEFDNVPPSRKKLNENFGYLFQTDDQKSMSIREYVTKIVYFESLHDILYAIHAGERIQYESASGMYLVNRDITSEGKYDFQETPKKMTLQQVTEMMDDKISRWRAYADDRLQKMIEYINEVGPDIGILEIMRGIRDSVDGDSEKKLKPEHKPLMRALIGWQRGRYPAKVVESTHIENGFAAKALEIHDPETGKAFIIEEQTAREPGIPGLLQNPNKQVMKEDDFFEG